MFNKIKKSLFLFLSFQLGFNFLTIAQHKPQKASAISKQKIEPKTESQSEDLNKYDKQHQKQGMWFYSYDSKFGDPGYYEFGSYKDNLKTGLWYKLSKEQQIISIETYKYNVLDGMAQYFENGKLITIGNYRGIYTPYKFDTVLIINPLTSQDSLVIIAAEKGFTKHGLWRYYHPISGQLTTEREYQVDILLKEKHFRPLAQQDSKTIDYPKMPHEGGKDRGWNTGKYKSRKSLIK